MQKSFTDSFCNFLVHFCGFELWLHLLVFLLHLSFAALFPFWLQLTEATAMAGTVALPLQEYIASLDQTSLPNILQVCSGVYFQGGFIYLFNRMNEWMKSLRLGESKTKRKTIWKKYERIVFWISKLFLPVFVADMITVWFFLSQSIEAK